MHQLNQQLQPIEKIITSIDKLTAGWQDSSELLELAHDDHDKASIEHLTTDIEQLNQLVAELEMERMFSGKLDNNNAFLEINAGSGGTEAQDWAEMLLRMYLRFANIHNFKAEIVSISDGEVAGIKSASIKIDGPRAYGWLRTETGIHRLVRKSPFDSGNRRHTSFAAVSATAEIDDDIDIKLDMSVCRVDTYRASGAGGQHVNKTDSAIRITHEPTGIVAQCQSSRSQHQNRDNALKQLKAKLYELELSKQQSENQKVQDSKVEISWGNQIRSYVLDQSRIKDLRTGVETSNTGAVLDGELDKFIIESLLQEVT
jgi:peptide chain release factor 2